MTGDWLYLMSTLCEPQTACTVFIHWVFEQRCKVQNLSPFPVITQTRLRLGDCGPTWPLSLTNTGQVISLLWSIISLLWNNIFNQESQGFCLFQNIPSRADGNLAAREVATSLCSVHMAPWPLLSPWGSTWTVLSISIHDCFWSLHWTYKRVAICFHFIDKEMSRDN